MVPAHIIERRKNWRFVGSTERDNLRKRHANMIWALILFGLITIAPPNNSDSLEDVVWRNGLPDERDTICSRLDFVVSLF